MWPVCRSAWLAAISCVTIAHMGLHCGVAESTERSLADLQLLDEHLNPATMLQVRISPTLDSGELAGRRHTADRLFQ